MIRPRENYIDQAQPEQKPKLIKKTQLTKKTIISPNNNIIQGENYNTKIRSQNDKNNETITITENKLGFTEQEKDNNASFLMKTILKAFYLSTWKKKVKAMKYFSRAYNPQRVNFKKLIKEISSVIKQHKFEYFTEICENIDSLPMPNNVVHDKNFGSIRIINKEFLSKKYSDKITLLAENNYNKKISGLKYYLIESFKKIKDNKETYGEDYMKQTIADNSNHQQYMPTQDNKNKQKESLIKPKVQNVKDYMKQYYYNKENTNINNNKNTNLKPNTYTNTTNAYYNNTNAYNNTNVYNNNKNTYVQPNVQYYNSYNISDTKKNTQNTLQPKINNVKQYMNQQYYNNTTNTNTNKYNYNKNQDQINVEQYEYLDDNDYIDDNNNYVESETNYIYVDENNNPIDADYIDENGYIIDNYNSDEIIYDENDYPVDEYNANEEDYYDVNEDNYVNEYENYEEGDYDDNNVYEDTKYQQNYKYNDNKNNNTEYAYYNDINNDNNLQYEDIEEEYYYYEQPKQKVEIKKVTYNTPYTSQTKNYNYIINDRNKALVNDVYTNNKKSSKNYQNKTYDYEITGLNTTSKYYNNNSGANKTMKYNNNSGTNNTSKYYNYKNQAQAIKNTEASSYKNYTTTVHNKYGNHSYYVSK